MINVTILCCSQNAVSYWAFLAPVIVSLIAGVFAIWQVRVNNIIKNELDWLNDMQTRIANIIFDTDKIQTPDIAMRISSNLYTIIVKLDDENKFQDALKKSCENYLTILETKNYFTLTEAKSQLIATANQVFKREQKKSKKFRLFS